MSQYYEVEFLEGLRSFVESEIKNKLGKSAQILSSKSSSLIMRYRDEWHRLLYLRTPVAVYQIHTFNIPRPKALLGHEYLSDLAKKLTDITDVYPAKTFKTFRFSAAGKDSSVFDRLGDSLSRELKLKRDEDDADLFIRMRPTTKNQIGWDVLIRLTPRPLGTREWRVCDMPGALNATVATAMIELTQPQKSDILLNMMCGSGTLMIERFFRMPAEAAVGIDTDQGALDCCTQNIKAADLDDVIEITQMDAINTDFVDGAFDAIVADLPWGQLVGSHEENEILYPQLLAEAARLIKPNRRAIFLSHEIKLMEKTIESFEDTWTLKRTVKVFQGGLHPRIYVLERL